jgi:hypothetical protein
MRLDTRVKAAYEREIVERHGVLQPYAGVELERELAALVGTGRLSALFDAVHRLSDALGEEAVQKKTQTPPRSESTMCRYRIRARVRDDVMDLASEADVTYPRDLVERVMWDYAQGRSAVDKAVDRMGRIRDRAESELGASDSTTERRKLEIANALSERPEWNIDDFDKAVDEHVKGISSGSYARKRYLKPVLDELGYTWHPKIEGAFTPSTKDFIPDERDPRTKPYLLLDREEKREVVRRDAVEAAASKTDTGKSKYTVKQGLRALDGRPTQQSVEQILRHLADDDERFSWDESEAVALVEADTQPRSQPASEDVRGELDAVADATPAHNE